jgi:hypothetical protein
MMRGSTLLLHATTRYYAMSCCEATHWDQLRSALHLRWITDLAPCIGSLLSSPDYSSSSTLEVIILLFASSIAKFYESCKPHPGVSFGYGEEPQAQSVEL